MAKKRIQGITVEIGGDTTNLAKSLKNVDDNIKNTQSQLKDVEKLLKLDPTNTELLSQKQKLLGEAVKDTSDRLASLKTASEEAAKTKDNYDDWKAKITPIQTEITKTTDELNKLKKRSEEANEQLSKGEISQEQYDDLQREIKETEDKLKDLKKSKEKVDDEFGHPISPEKFDALQREIFETEQNLKSLENQTSSADNKEKSLTETISEQKQDLSKLKTEYVNTCSQYGKNSAQAQTLAGKIKALTDEYNSNVDKVADAEDELRRMNFTEKSLTDTLSEQKKDLSKLKTEYVNACSQYGKNSTQAKTLAQQIKSLSGEVADNEKKVSVASSQADKYDRSLDNVEDSAEDAKKGTEKLSSATETMIHNFSAATVAVGKLIADGIEKFASSAIDASKEVMSTYADFESEMSGVKALISSQFDSAEELDKAMNMLNETAKEYGSTTSFTASQAAEAMSYMGLAGWSAQEMTEGLPGILNLAAAAEMDLGQASDIVTDYLTAFGKKADYAGKFADQMAYTMSTSNTSVEDLGEAYKNCAATANSLGYSIEETTAVIATMANAGVKGGEAGTALNAIMTRLATDTKGCASQLAEFGVNIYDSEGNMQSLSSILQGVSDVWGNLTDQQQANLSKIIAGTNHYSALQTIMTGLSDEASSAGKGFADYASALENCEGTAAEQAKIKLDNLKGSLTLLGSAAEGAAIGIGEKLAPSARTALDSMTEVLNIFNADGLDAALLKVREFVTKLSVTLSKEIPEILPKLLQSFNDIFMTLVKSIGQLLPVLISKVIPIVNSSFLDLTSNLLTYISGLLPQIIESVSSAISQIVADIKKYVPIISETVVTIIDTLISAIGDFLPDIINTAFTLLSGFVTGALNALPKIATIALDLMEKLIDSVLSVIPQIAPLADDIVGSVYGIINNLPQIIQSGIEVINNFSNSLIENLPQILDMGITIVMELINGLLDSLPDIIMTAGELWQGLIDGITASLPTLIPMCFEIIKTMTGALIDNTPKILECAKKLIVSLAKGIVDSKKKLKEKLPEIISTIVDSFGELPDKMLNLGINIVEGLWNGINDMAGWISEKLQGFGDNILNGIKDFFGIHSPSKVFREDIGFNLMYGFAEGIEDKVKMVVNVVKSMGDNVMKSAENSLNFNMSGTAVLTGGDTSGTVNNYYKTDNSRTVNQTNNSPKSLSRLEIYRQTKNALGV